MMKWNLTFFALFLMLVGNVVVAGPELAAADGQPGAVAGASDGAHAPDANGPAAAAPNATSVRPEAPAWTPEQQSARLKQLVNACLQERLGSSKNSNFLSEAAQKLF